MIEVLPESESDTLAVMISGRLSRDDHEKLRPEMELRAKEHDRFDVLVDLTDAAGLEPEAVVDDLAFTKDFASDIGRMAIVTGDSLFQRAASAASSPLGAVLGVDVERFDTRVEAWKWLRGD